MQLPIGNASSMPLPANVFKEIDILSMEQFGHNTAINRKDQGAILSHNCDTYSEQGVIKAENHLKFVNTETINVNDNWDIDNDVEARCSTIAWLS